jgi:EAL domain-containing protein (putative c-di-GMP-specific phosphodiesterase class I)/DNA-binding NarL/FixJ family response regulator
MAEELLSPSMGQVDRADVHARLVAPVVAPGAAPDRPIVLVADDDPRIRSLLKRALEREGFEIILAADGREALDLLKLHDVAVALLDIHMPVLDGIQTMRAIRANERSNMPAIFLITGSAVESDRIRGLDSGADDYLNKPIAVKELAARLRAQLRGRAAWSRERERGRADRRRLLAAIEKIPRDLPLLLLAAKVVESLPPVLGIDGIAILHFGHGTVSSIAASGALRATYPANRKLAAEEGRVLVSRADLGPWLETAARLGSDAEPVDLAYVPFELGPTPTPHGCLVFAVRPGTNPGQLSHHLSDLIDATGVIVTVLRPAVEHAETADAAVMRLRRVIDRHEFAIYLQPIVRLDTGTVVAVEALTRFSDGTPTMVQFAEASALGLGLLLERAAVSAAIEAATSLPAGVALSVNLSAEVLRLEHSLPMRVAVAGRPLIIEITEHERIDDYEAVRAALLGLGPNVRLAVDDAGSGYASLRHILALKPAFVKLDIEWVRGIDGDPVRRALVSGLIYFASETGCELIAEGIETQAELEALRLLGIKLGQGYLLGRPQPVDELTVNS